MNNIKIKRPELIPGEILVKYVHNDINKPVRIKLLDPLGGYFTIIVLDHYIPEKIGVKTTLATWILRQWNSE